MRLSEEQRAAILAEGATFDGALAVVCNADRLVGVSEGQAMRALRVLAHLDSIAEDDHARHRVWLRENTSEAMERALLVAFEEACRDA